MRFGVRVLHQVDIDLARVGHEIPQGAGRNVTASPGPCPMSSATITSPFAVLGVMVGAFVIDDGRAIRGRRAGDDVEGESAAPVMSFATTVAVADVPDMKVTIRSEPTPACPRTRLAARSDPVCSFV